MSNTLPNSHEDAHDTDVKHVNGGLPESARCGDSFVGSSSGVHPEDQPEKEGRYFKLDKGIRIKKIETQTVQTCSPLAHYQLNAVMYSLIV